MLLVLLAARIHPLPVERLIPTEWLARQHRKQDLAFIAVDRLAIPPSTVASLDNDYRVVLLSSEGAVPKW